MQLAGLSWIMNSMSVCISYDKLPCLIIFYRGGQKKRVTFEIVLPLWWQQQDKSKLQAALWQIESLCAASPYRASLPAYKLPCLVRHWIRNEGEAGRIQAACGAEKGRACHYSCSAPKLSNSRPQGAAFQGLRRSAISCLKACRAQIW